MDNETVENAAASTTRDEKAAEDILLVERVKSGDFVAFERLVKKYEARVYNHCLRFFKRQEDVEDVLQETFLKMYRSLDTFRGESAFSTWLFKIATNFCLMRLRKEKKVDFVSIDQPMEFDGSMLERGIVDWSKNPSIIASNEEVRKALDAAIAEIPEDKRVVLILKDVEGFSNVEIGQMLDMSVAAVKSRLHRARLQLRESLSQYFDGVGLAVDMEGEGR